MASSIPRFTRRDFQWIADTIKESTFLADKTASVGSPAYKQWKVRKQMTQSFTLQLRHTNPNFRASTFVEACGIDLEDIEGIN